MSKNYYDLLGISRESGDDEIKKAYRKLAVKYHPDKNKGDKGSEAKFKEINEAYDVLRDSQKKAAYDRYGHDAYTNHASGGGFNPGSSRGGFSSSGGFDFDFGADSPFSDIFEMFSGGAAGGRGNASARREMRGSDLRYETSITLEEAFKGKDIELKIKTHVKCTDCSGTGSENGKAPRTCPHCRGTGVNRVNQGFFIVEKTCSACNGTGHIIENSCKTCKGSGRINKLKSLRVSIPAGIENGSNIRLQGEGEVGLRGGRSGDLYIFVSVKNHQLFERDGSSIRCHVPISIVTAAIGGEVSVPTIDGKKAMVNVSAGTQTGQVLKLRGKGMSMVRSSFRGDMFVHIAVETPTNLTKKQRELLEEFDKENSSYPKSDGFFAKVKEFLQEL